MDFWNWLWVLAFPALLLWGWVTITGAGKRALSRHLSEQAPEPDAKTLLAEARSLKEAEHTRWLSEFQAILRKTCKHRYNGNQWNDWWKCLDCGYEQEWEYSGSCACRTNAFRDISAAKPTHVLMERSRYCIIHGSTPVVEAAQKRRDGYSGGGYLGLHNDRYIR